MQLLSIHPLFFFLFSSLFLHGTADTPYLSNKIRLGVGARGSTFVFTRIPEEDFASSGYKIALESKPLTQKQVSLGMMCFHFSVQYPTFYR